MSNGAAIRFCNELEALPKRISDDVVAAMVDAADLAKDERIARAAVTLYLLRERQGSATVRHFIDDLRSVAINRRRSA